MPKEADPLFVQLTDVGRVDQRPKVGEQVRQDKEIKAVLGQTDKDADGQLEGVHPKVGGPVVVAPHTGEHHKDFFPDGVGRHERVAVKEVEQEGQVVVQPLVHQRAGEHTVKTVKHTRKEAKAQNYTI